MTQDRVIQAWKSPACRARLSAAELASLPAHPAGIVHLSEDELTEVRGGTTVVCVTFGPYTAVTVTIVTNP